MKRRALSDLAWNGLTDRLDPRAETWKRVNVLIRPTPALPSHIAALGAMSPQERQADDHARYLRDDARYAAGVTEEMIRRAIDIPRTTGRGKR